MKNSKRNGQHIRDERLRKIAEAERIEAPEVDSGRELATNDAAERSSDAEEQLEPASSEAPAQSPAGSEHAGASADDGDAFAGLDTSVADYSPAGEFATAGSYVAPDYGSIRVQRKRRALRALGITIAVVVGILLVAYIAGAVVFMGRFLPNTNVGTIDMSMKTDQEAAALLDDVARTYKVKVTGNGFSYETTGPEIDMDVDSNHIVETMHQDLDAWRWPVLIVLPSHDESNRLEVTYDKKATRKAVKQAVKEFNKKAKAPVDATIQFDSKTSTYTVKPEEEGTQLSAKEVAKTAVEGIDAMVPAIALSNDHLLKPKVLSTDEKLIESAELATGMVSARITLTMNGQTVNEIDGSELEKFVSIDDKLKVKLDETALNAWVRDIANGYDTIGTQRSYTRADGKAITVKGGVYGWEVDTAATEQMILDAVKAGEKTTLDLPCISTAAVFSAPGERDWGNRYIDVDISEQHVRFYGDNGKVIWEADCITGSPDGKHDTWQGVWTLNNKESPSTLIGYLDNGKKEYETEVKYWMAFEGNGIGFHDATWQPDFGGSMYAEGYGSHGCVNLSMDSAQSLYGIIQIGDVVVVHS